MADSGAIARKRKFVQQRAKELESKGKKADRAKLRRKWETGMVERDEFYAPGERARLRAANKKKPATGPRQGSPVDRMPEKKAPKQGKPADRMPQGGPKRMKPADRYPGRRPGTSVTPNMETPKPKSPGPKQGKPADRMPQGGPKRSKPADRYPTPKSKPKQGPGGVALPGSSKKSGKSVKTSGKVYKTPASRFADYLMGN